MSGRVTGGTPPGGKATGVINLCHSVRSSVEVNEECLEIYPTFYFGNLNEGHNFGDPVVDGRVLLK
jgi:hypothetical protein